MRLRRVKVTVAAALATAAMGVGVSAVPAQAAPPSQCEQRIGDAIKDRFGSKAALVKLVNDRFNTNFTVNDLNNLIERFCAR